MKDSSLGAEFLISPRLVLVALLVVSCLFSIGAEFFFFSWSITSKSMALVIVLTLITLCGLFLLNHVPWLGRWFTIFGLAIMVHGYGLWMHFPGSLAWAVIPVAFATCLVGIPAAAITAIAESLFVLLVARYGGIAFDPAALATPLVAIWASWRQWWRCRLKSTSAPCGWPPICVKPSSSSKPPATIAPA